MICSFGKSLSKIFGPPLKPKSYIRRRKPFFSSRRKYLFWKEEVQTCLFQSSVSEPTKGGFSFCFVLCFFLTYLIDHEEKGTVVCNRSHGDIKSCDNTKFASSLYIVDERITRSIKEVAGNATLGKCQLVSVSRRKKKQFPHRYRLTVDRPVWQLITLVANFRGFELQRALIG